MWARFYVWISYLAIMRQDYHEAARLLNKAVASKPTLLRAHALLGMVYQHLGELHMAHEAYNRATEMAPDDGSLYLGRAVVLDLLGDHKTALSDLSVAVNLRPNDPKVYLTRAAIHIMNDNPQAGIADTELALETLKKSRMSTKRRRPYRAAALSNRSVAYQLMGDFQRGIEDCNQAIRANPRYAPAYNSRASLYSHLGLYAEGLRDAEKAIRLHPGRREFWNTRASLYVGTGQYQLALSDFQMGAGRPPLHPYRYFSEIGIAVSHYLLGNVELAKAMWRDLIAKDENLNSLSYTSALLCKWMPTMADAAARLAREYS